MGFLNSPSHFFRKSWQSSLECFESSLFWAVPGRLEQRGCRILSMTFFKSVESQVKLSSNFSIFCHWHYQGNFFFLLFVTYGPYNSQLPFSNLTQKGKEARKPNNRQQNNNNLLLLVAARMMCFKQQPPARRRQCFHPSPLILPSIIYELIRFVQKNNDQMNTTQHNNNNNNNNNNHNKCHAE